MAIKLKAIERNVSFVKGEEKWAFVLQADLYNRLSANKVISEAALRSGIGKGAINAAWDAIGEVIKAWATEGHSVAVPGLGSMRFGVRSTSVSDVNKVGSDLITTRRVIFTPNTEIKKELAETSISITCYDRDGNVVKRVTDDGSDVEEEDDDTRTPTAKSKFTVNVTSDNMAQGVATGSGEYEKGSEITITAVPNAGFKFKKWSDGNTQASRTIRVNENLNLTASFESSAGGEGGDEQTEL